MDIGKNFGTDKKLETSGVWVPLGDGAEVKIVRNTHPAAVALATAEYKKNRGIVQAGGTAAAALVKRIGLRQLVEVTLVDWKNIEVDGAVVPYSRENAKMVFERYPDFADLVASLTMEAGYFREAESGEDAKNSATTSAGTSA